MLVWGNYCNVIGGAVPGQHLLLDRPGADGQDRLFVRPEPDVPADRAPRPSGPAGRPDNPVVCRHVHSVAYNPAENAFYACTGDHDRADGPQRRHECHWLRGTYDAATAIRGIGKFSSRSIPTRATNPAASTLSMASSIGHADANGNNGTMPHDRGIFRCDPADLADVEQAHACCSTRNTNPPT